MQDFGDLEYTARAFGMDAAQAMRNRIDRGLIELITNSDDAYGTTEGPIFINVLKGDENFPFTFEVQDQATGLTLDEMGAAFLKIGEKKSRLANGQMSRGLLGRGAKDAAIFGQITFSAIKDGNFSSITVFASGKYKVNFRDVIATPEIYEMLSLNPGQNGLTASIQVSAASKLKVPEPAKLRDLLSNTAQLRDLVARREVIYSDFRKPAIKGRLITSLPYGELVFEKDFTLKGFDGLAKLVVRKLPERQTTSVTETSAHGLLVKSGMTVYENTWFDLANRAPSRMLSGEVIVPQITDVLRHELDSEEIVQLSILTRTRDGIETSHPLYIELSRQISIICNDYFASLENEASSNQRQGEKLNQDFKIAAQAIKSELENILREIDDDPDDGPSGLIMSSFDCIPSVIYAELGSNITISLRSDDELIANELQVTSSNNLLKSSGFQFGSAHSPVWHKHPRLESKSSTQIRIRAGLVASESTIKFALGSNIATCLVVVRESKHVAEELPAGLEFSQSEYSTAPGRGKNLVLRAPIEYSGEKLDISHQGTPIASCPAQVTLEPTTDGSWAEAKIHIKTGLNTGSTTVSAATSDAKSISAILKIVESIGGKGPKIDFELLGDRDPFVRYELDSTDNLFVCRVFGQHSGFAGVFGSYDNANAKFKNEDSPEARAVLAQVIAQAFAEALVEREYVSNPVGSWDAPFTISRVKSRADVFVNKLFKALGTSAS